jgi:hypothetical protein
MVSLLYIVSTAPHVFVWSYFDYFDQYIGDFICTQQEAKALYMLGLFTISVLMLRFPRGDRFKCPIYPSTKID